MVNKLFTAIATLTGTVIGAGFLGIPYIVSRSGFLLGLFWMVVISIIMLLVNLSLGQIILSTKTIHHLPGYASKYLGYKTKIFIFISSVIGLYAALVAYLIGGGESLSFIFSNSMNYSIFAGVLFWGVFALITIKGIQSFKKIEPLGVLAVFIVTIIIGILSFGKINFSNLSYINSSFFFAPFGVVLFSFLGVSSLPAIRRVLQKNEKLMKKAIIIGSLIPLLVYVLFTIVVIGLYGMDVSEIATISLGRAVTLLGILTMFTAFLSLNLALQDTYRFDFKVKFRLAWILATILPLIFFLIIKFFALAGFVKILSIGGSVSGGLIGIAILLAHHKLKTKATRKPEFKIHIPLIFKIFFILLFLVGIVVEFL